MLKILKWQPNSNKSQTNPLIAWSSCWPVCGRGPWTSSPWSRSHRRPAGVRTLAPRPPGSQRGGRRRGSGRGWGWRPWPEGGSWPGRRPAGTGCRRARRLTEAGSAGGPSEPHTDPRRHTPSFWRHVPSRLVNIFPNLLFFKINYHHDHIPNTGCAILNFFN